MTQYYDYSTEQAVFLFNKGYTYKEIAKQLGASRNSIAGKLHRAGIKRGQPYKARKTYPDKRYLHVTMTHAEQAALRVLVLMEKPISYDDMTDTDADGNCYQTLINGLIRKGKVRLYGNNKHVLIL